MAYYLRVTARLAPWSVTAGAVLSLVVALGAV